METTPLHLVSQYGHFDVCKYICDNTMFVKPLRRDRSTPMTLFLPNEIDYDEMCLDVFRA